MRYSPNLPPSHACFCVERKKFSCLVVQFPNFVLTSGKQLALREDGVKGVAIPGLSVHRPTDADGLLAFLQKGNSNRTQHPTDANAESSRSHAVFQVSQMH